VDSFAKPEIDKMDRSKFAEEAIRLAIESVEKGWGGPFGAVIVKDGEIIGRGQNRVLLTGCPVFHAEITAIIDASSRLNPKALLGSDYHAGTLLEMIPRPPASPDLVPQRARMLKGCEIYINGAPCPMCMSAIYWSRIDRVYFGASLEDTAHIGFSDAFQYEDFLLPWENRRGIVAIPNFERDACLAAYRAWENKQDRHPY
jgi:guanine deaminase